MNSNVFKSRYCEKFAIWFFAPDPTSSLVILDLYPTYETFCKDNGAPVGTVSEMVNSITKNHKKNAVVQDGIIKGLRYKSRFEVVKEPEQPKVSPKEYAIRRRFMQFLSEHPNYRTGSGFSAAALANFSSSDLTNGSYSPGWAKLDLEFTKDWLRGLEDVFERNELFYYRPLC